MVVFVIFVFILTFLLLVINGIFSTHNPYKEKKTPFECGIHSFLTQNRSQFTIVFFIFGLLFLVFDLEILLAFPASVSDVVSNNFSIWGFLIFIALITTGFVYEICKNALHIEVKQPDIISSKYKPVKNLKVF